MSHGDVVDIVQGIENAPARGDNHDLSGVYDDIREMQRDSGGPGSADFQADLRELNDTMHERGLLPNVEILGVDDANNILTRDISTGREIAQNASSVNDFDALMSSGNPDELRAAALARAFGIDVTRNPDGSYDVRDPISNPEQAASEIINKILRDMFGAGGGRSDSRPPGMNWWQAQAWGGWPEPEEHR